MEKKEVVFFTRLPDQYRDDGHIHLESYEVQCKIYK